MFKIPIYKTEANEGLSDLIKKNNSIAYCVPVEPCKEIDQDIKKFFTSASSVEELDFELLYPTKSVLVTSNWNKNDDVFGVTQIWNSRNTPVHKPTNINHDHNQIVGHITNTWVVDEKGDLINDDTYVDDLPEIIHVCNGAVIYKHYKEPELTERALNLIEEIEAGEKYVSMECLFPDFDYAVVTPDNEFYTVIRNEETSFLTKHLRAYGGKGNYNNYKIGRFIKNMVFSGKGYVDKPANPDSIIFSDDKPSFSFSSIKQKSNFILKSGVENINSEAKEKHTKKTNDSKENIMSDTNEFYKTEVAELKNLVAKLTEENKELSVKLTEANAGSLKGEIEELTSSNESLTSAKAELEKQLSEAKSSYDVLSESLKKITEEKTQLEAEIQKAKAEKIFADRVSVLVDAGIDKEKAQETVSKFINLNDEQFSEIASVYSESAKKMKYDKMKQEKMKEEEMKAAQMMDDKKKKEDKKKMYSEKASDEESDPEENLDDVEVESGADTGSAEADDQTEAYAKTREAISKFFAATLGGSNASEE